MQIRLFGRDPALWINALAALLSILVTLNIKGLSIDQAAAIVSVLTAGGGLLAALATRPFSVGAFTTFASTLVVLGAAYGLHVPPETLGAIQAAIVAVLTLVARGYITPLHDPRPLPSDARGATTPR